MRSLRNGVTTLFAATCLLAGGMFAGASVARATTGPSANLPPTFKVGSKFAGQFVGQYTLKSVPFASHIKSAALGIEVNDSGFLYGIGQFYGYDTAGSQSSWVATLYHFHQTSKSRMTIDLLAPATASNLLGRLVVAPPQHNILAGTIALEGHTYPVSFRRISTR